MVTTRATTAARPNATGASRALTGMLAGLMAAGAVLTAAATPGYAAAPGDGTASGHAVAPADDGHCPIPLTHAGALGRLISQDSLGGTCDALHTQGG
ncbi:hypothetical protein K7472_00455 [Streptomyces sp. PTM05]|uniref:Uncharacterized protein n=1 Tax=Streptantibioticus parmotrematis TaxID=2873249 RepID=A0ABS7QJG6_9ACTN|nr:hypothetical protein [Streptantibioticus parmotrematis]MBY8883316.1 hypothetical protein [Streptantibioticus parmotrematis]